MSVPALLTFLALLGLMTVFDVRYRMVPVLFFGFGIGLAVGMIPLTLSVIGAVVGYGVGLLADLPWGDRFAGVLLGLWLGWESVLFIWFAALLAGLLTWLLWEDGFIADFPGDWPFIPYLTVPACAIVLAKGGW